MTEQLTTKALSICAAVMLLAGCEPPPPGYYYDQTLRREVFMQCLEKAPVGPVSTKYNDWSEVVSECDSSARDIATTSTAPDGYYRQATKVER